MANLDDNGAPGGGGDSRAEERSTPTQLELRVRQLEGENASLRAELDDIKAKHAVDRDLLIAHICDDMPKTKEEVDEMIRTSVPFSTVMRQLEAEFGLGDRK